jgi:hypothetical protein
VDTYLLSSFPILTPAPHLSLSLSLSLSFFPVPSAPLQESHVILWIALIHFNQRQVEPALISLENTGAARLVGCPAGWAGAGGRALYPLAEGKKEEDLCNVSVMAARVSEQHFACV